MKYKKIKSKKEYLNTLYSELKQHNVLDIPEIMEEFNELFELKKADGFTDKEIIDKLADPQELAVQYEDDSYTQKNSIGIMLKKSSIGIVKILSLAFLDFILGISWLSIYLFVFCIGLLSVSLFALGFFMITGITCGGKVYVPHMPFIENIFASISSVALGILIMVFVIVTILYMNQITKKYLNWNVKVITGKYRLPIPLKPKINLKFKRKMKNSTVISFLVLAVCFIGILLASLIGKGTLRFWTHWHW